MKLQYCSDLHLEFYENKYYLKEHPIKPKAEVLILAGDIVPFATMKKHEDFFNFCADNFSVTYWIPGNHEYYFADAGMRSGSFKEKIRSNVFLLNNKSVQHGDVKIIFSTLWSHISVEKSLAIQRGMSDFNVVEYNGVPFTPTDFNALHDKSIAFIKKEQRTKKKSKTIVVTHHVPTILNYPPKYKGSALNEAFAIELFPFIEESQFDYWIYGHHHNNLPPFKIGKTKLVTNQLGYVSYGENTGFGNKIIIL